MATDKRDRQRANREAKKAEEAKAAKRKHVIGQIKRYGGYAVLFIGALLALRFFTG
jgi:hypothetical protein